MGREIKRVPLDFDWPLGKTWAGFLNPFYNPDTCKVCGGDGSSKQAKVLKDKWYGNAPFDPAENKSTPFNPNDAVVLKIATFYLREHTPEYINANLTYEAKRLVRIYNSHWCHHLSQDDVDVLWKEGRLSDFNPNWTKDHNEGVPAPLAADVNKWSLIGFGHDSINQYLCVKARCEKLGVSDTCPVCQGEGVIWDSQAAKNLAESWKDIEPPVGEGWQLWETTSEGSPISPVFETSHEFVQYLVGEGYSLASAKAFVKQGWAMSMGMITDADGKTTVYKDIESASMGENDNGE